LPQHNDYLELGLKFEIPEGWSAEQKGDIVTMGHQTIPGLIIMSFNEAESAELLKMEAMKGVLDDGVNLKTMGDFEISNDNKVSGVYEGIWDGAEVKCFVIGLVNKFGPGVNILAVTTKEVYSDQHVMEVKKIATTVVFYEPIVDPSKQILFQESEPLLWLGYSLHKSCNPKDLLFSIGYLPVLPLMPYCR
jgi:hypothetical protein